MRKLLFVLCLPLLAQGQSNEWKLSQFMANFGGNYATWPAWATNNSFTYGGCNSAVALAGIADAATPAQVLCFSSDSQQASYSTRDRAGFFAQEVCPAPVASAVAGTYTTTTFVPNAEFSGSTVAKFRVGMYVITQEASTFYSGKITGWATNGTSLTVSAWYQQGNAGAGQQPPNTDTLIINPATKCFGGNIVVTVPSSSIATDLTGLEIDGNSSLLLSKGNVLDIVNIGPDLIVNGMSIRGQSFGYTYGLHIWGAGEGNLDPAAGIISTQQTGVVLDDNQVMTGGAFIQYDRFSVNYQGKVDIGSVTSALAEPVNLHSSGHSGADVSLTPGGGTGNGDGALTITASAGLTIPTNMTVVGNGNFALVDDAIVCLAAVSACGNEALRITSAGASNVNQIRATGSVTGSNPSIAAGGSDGTLDLALSGKGASGAVLASDGLRLPTATVSTLPTCNTAYKGVLYYVTDASSPTYNATLSGGSSTITLAFCNGTNWTAH